MRPAVAPRIDTRGRTTRAAALAGTTATLLAAVLLAGCMATIPVEDPDMWSQRAELVIGERGIYDAGEITVTLVEAGDADALVLVERNGAPREARLTTDPGGYATFPPYEVRLVSADVDERAIIEVTRPR